MGESGCPIRSFACPSVMALRWRRGHGDPLSLILASNSIERRITRTNGWLMGNACGPSGSSAFAVQNLSATTRTWQFKALGWKHYA
jgi:hypothetical protein